MSHAVVRFPPRRRDSDRDKDRGDGNHIELPGRLHTQVSPTVAAPRADLQLLSDCQFFICQILRKTTNFFSSSPFVAFGRSFLSLRDGVTFLLLLPLLPSRSPRNPVQSLPLYLITTLSVATECYFPTMRQSRYTTLLFFLLGLFTSAQAQGEGEEKPTIYRPTGKAYNYHGCYNETTEIPGTVGNRALSDGIMLESPDAMTVEKCWDYCKTNTSTAYKYAGLEYSRQCWCATKISSLSAKLDDSACDLSCDGNKTQVCGGSLKLAVYEAGAASAQIAWTAGLVVVGVFASFSLL
ncbi:WSC domain-containing protein [Podospora australis]|uniref:WSC domain-containing protein n=1 Tax=Podospora australis TaxID=1536484 RepID=A0AAN6WXP4_9PEZI|nr:WSC domain-containing protein [Podospora australis]